MLVVTKQKYQKLQNKNISGYKTKILVFPKQKYQQLQNKIIGCY